MRRQCRWDKPDKQGIDGVWRQTNLDKVVLGDLWAKSEDVCAASLFNTETLGESGKRDADVKSISRIAHPRCYGGGAVQQVIVVRHQVSSTASDATSTYWYCCLALLGMRSWKATFCRDERAFLH